MKLLKNYFQLALAFLFNNLLTILDNYSEFLCLFCCSTYFSIGHLICQRLIYPFETSSLWAHVCRCVLIWIPLQILVTQNNHDWYFPSYALNFLKTWLIMLEYNKVKLELLCICHCWGCLLLNPLSNKESIPVQTKQSSVHVDLHVSIHTVLVWDFCLFCLFQLHTN